MRYWWVNQNRTYGQEVAGGYLWSPKRKTNGHRNPFYEAMREVAPGDMVFSFCATRVKAVGMPIPYAYESPKPAEFGAAGRNWSDIGWRVDVSFAERASPPRPSEWMDVLRPMLPPKYSPLLPDGRGVQSIYLTELPEDLALALARLVGADVLAIANTEITFERNLERPAAELVTWEEHIRRQIECDPQVPETDREALVVARRGQGVFRRRVEEREKRCRVTLVDRAEHLRASHCKPWRDSSNAERLDGDNGLLLTPSVDHLFDRGFISFGDRGELLVSPVVHAPSVERMGIAVHEVTNVGDFNDGQRRYLEFHRDAVFLRRQSS